MIADVLEVETRGGYSPRNDTAARSIRIERLGALAFVTSSDRRGAGTTVRVRLSLKFESI